jgi:plastocyanin
MLPSSWTSGVILRDMTLKRTLPLLACLAVAAAGCGSSNSTSSGGKATPSESGGGTPIDMKNIQFSPREQAVKVGQKVTWTNQDDVDHNVTSSGGPDDFHSSDFGKGKSFSYTPAKPGKIAYTCTLHPGMDAVLNVTS